MKTLRIALALCTISSPFALQGAAASSQEHGTQDHDLQHVMPSATFEFEPGAKPELEVQRAKTGHLLVHPTINGEDAGWFIFDTGAGICVLSTPHVDDFELKPAVDVPMNGVGGSGTTQSLLAPTLALGPLTLHDVPLMSTDLSFLRQHLGVEIVGVIGYGLFAKCIVELDLVAPRIALYEAKTYALPAGEWAPLAFDHLIPTVTAKYEGREGRFQLDIGSNSGLTFQEPAVRRFDLLAGRELRDGKLGGVGGFVATKNGKIASFELAGLRLTDVEATFQVEAKGVGAEDGRDGSIGTKLLEPFLLTFDYAGERISFRPRVAAPAGE